MDRTIATQNDATTGRPPDLPGGLPFLGHVIAFRRNPVALLQQGREHFGDIFSLSVLGQRFAVLTGPSANEAFFRAPEDQLSAKEAYGFTVPMFGAGIAYDASSALMDEQLGFLFPALHEDRLRTYVQKMHREAVEFFAGWGDQGEIDLPAAMNQLIVYIASRCLLGDEIRETLTAEFAAAYHDLQAGINTVGFIWPYLPVPAHRRRDRAHQRIVV